MIKQDVGINATSLTGDIVGARAALLFSAILLVERREILVNESVLSKCGCGYVTTKSSPCDKNNKLNEQSKTWKRISSVYWKREFSQSIDLTQCKIIPCVINLYPSE